MTPQPNSPVDQPAEEVGVLVVGGGNAGVSLAARTARHGVEGITLVELSTVHTYRPLLNYVGAGVVPLARAQRAQASVVPDGVHWIQEAVEYVDPDARVARTDRGRRLHYAQLVLCAGSEPDWDRLPGGAEALRSPSGITTFLADHAETARRRLAETTSGSVVFVLADEGGPCPGTALKVLFLACERWAASGASAAVDVTLVTAASGITGLPAVDARLRAVCERHGIRVVDEAAVERVDVEGRRVTASSRGERVEVGYDLLFLVPPYQAPAWVAEAGLGTAEGYVDVDPHTLRHRRYDTVWACGDVADADCARSGGALRKQTAVLDRNLRAVLAGGTPTARYDGYSVLPVATAEGRALVAEFDRGGLRSDPVGLRHLDPGRAVWLLDRHVLPQVYWRRILKGR